MTRDTNTINVILPFEVKDVDYFDDNLDDIDDDINDDIDEFEIPLLNPPDYDNDAALLEAIEYHKNGGLFITAEQSLANVEAAIGSC